MEPNLVEDPGTRTAGRATTAAWSPGLPMGEDHGCPAGGRRAPGLPGRRNAVATRAPAGRMPRWRPLGRAGPRARGRERAAVAVREVPRRRAGRARRDPVVVAAAAEAPTGEKKEEAPAAFEEKKEEVKRPLMREDLKVIQYQSQEADNTFITLDGTSPYNSTRNWAVKRHYREDNN